MYSILYLIEQCDGHADAGGDRRTGDDKFIAEVREAGVAVIRILLIYDPNQSARPIIRSQVIRDDHDEAMPPTTPYSNHRL